MTYVLGHDSHGHQITSRNGCSGSITIPVDGEHDYAANIFAIFDAEYTDAGGLTTHTQHTLQPRSRQAEHYKTSAGIATFDKAAAEGGKTVGNINNGDWIAFEPYRINNVTSFSARVSSAGSGGTLQVRAARPPAPCSARPPSRSPRLGHLHLGHRQHQQPAVRHHHALPDLRRHRDRLALRPGLVHLHHRQRWHGRNRSDRRPGR